MYYLRNRYLHKLWERLGFGSSAKEENVVSIGSGNHHFSDELKEIYGPATRKLINVSNGEVSQTSKEAVNGSQLYALEMTVNNLKTNVSNSNIVGGSDVIETKVDGNTIKVDLSETGKTTLAKVNNGINSQTDDGKTLNYQLGDTIKVTGDGKNLATTTTEGKISVRLNDDVKLNSVTTGNVFISTQGINAGGNKVVNVANGNISPTSKDAVNGSQLHATNIQVNQNTQNIANLGERVNHLDNKINRVNKDLRAGVAGSAAIAGLPQVRGHRKSMVAASAGNYKGQSAIAIGYSRASDNGKMLFKLSGSANTQGDIVSSIGLGYEW